MSDRDSRRRRPYRILWTAVLAAFVALAVAAWYIVKPIVDAEGGILAGGSGGVVVPAHYAVYLLWALGLAAAVAGARIGRRALVPGSRIGAGAAGLLGNAGQASDGDPSLAAFVVAMALVEFSAVSAVFLYWFSGAFAAYIVMTGIAMVGWLVAKPEFPPAGGASGP